MSRLLMGWRSTADVGIEYGPLRLEVSKYFGIDPADVTHDQVSLYERATP